MSKRLKGICYSILFPARLKVQDGETTRFFTSPQGASAWLELLPPNRWEMVYCSWRSPSLHAAEWLHPTCKWAPICTCCAFLCSNNWHFVTFKYCAPGKTRWYLTANLHIRINCALNRDTSNWWIAWVRLYECGFISTQHYKTTVSILYRIPFTVIPGALLSIQQRTLVAISCTARTHLLFNTVPWMLHTGWFSWYSIINCVHLGIMPLATPQTYGCLLHQWTLLCCWTKFLCI